MDEEKRHVAFRDATNSDVRTFEDVEGGDINGDYSQGGVVNASVTSTDDVFSSTDEDTAKQRRRRRVQKDDGPDLNIRFTRWREVSS